MSPRGAASAWISTTPSPSSRRNDRDGGRWVDFLAIDGEENNLYRLAPERRALSAVNVNSRNEVFRNRYSESPYGVAVTGGDRREPTLDGMEKGIGIAILW